MSDQLMFAPGELAPIMTFSCPAPQAEWVLGIVQDAFATGMVTGISNALRGGSFPEGITAESYGKQVLAQWQGLVAWTARPTGVHDENGYEKFEACVGNSKGVMHFERVAE